jgi:DNA-binding response OmpR family regulator
VPEFTNKYYNLSQGDGDAQGPWNAREAQPLDLLITDVIIPGGINGFALARMARMRRLGLRVIYLTGYEVPIEHGIGKVLRKPISLDVLVAEARNALAGPPDPPA